MVEWWMGNWSDAGMVKEWKVSGTILSCSPDIWGPKDEVHWAASPFAILAGSSWPHCGPPPHQVSYCTPTCRHTSSCTYNVIFMDMNSTSSLCVQIISHNVSYGVYMYMYVHNVHVHQTRQDWTRLSFLQSGRHACIYINLEWTRIDWQMSLNSCISYVNWNLPVVSCLLFSKLSVLLTALETHRLIYCPSFHLLLFCFLKPIIRGMWENYPGHWIESPVYVHVHVCT